ncbi:MAG TPA: hypothetical protein VH601_26280 [Bryobacteraceae bacterium]|jgi:hypothetical protein
MSLNRKVVIIAFLGTACVCLFAFNSGSDPRDGIAQRDEEAIRGYVENFGSAWNRHDGDGLFGRRAGEIDRINAFGGWIRDPEADARVMRRLLYGPFRQSLHQVRAERVRLVTSDIALVVIRITRPSGAQSGSMTALGSRSLHVLVKHEGKWELTGFANVPINPPNGAVREAEGDDVFYSNDDH